MRHDHMRLHEWCKQKGFTLIPSKEGEKEHQFHPIRKWRFDFAIPEIWAAIEIEGGVFIQGRHTRGAGTVKDMEKYNTASAMGWSIFRFTPAQFRAGAWIEYLEQYINNEGGTLG